MLLILFSNKLNKRKGTCGKHSAKLSYSIRSKVSIAERLKFTESSLWITAPRMYYYTFIEACYCSEIFHETTRESSINRATFQILNDLFYYILEKWTRLFHYSDIVLGNTFQPFLAAIVYFTVDLMRYLMVCCSACYRRLATGDLTRSRWKRWREVSN